MRVGDGLFGEQGNGGGRGRRTLAPIATLLDLYRVGGLSNPRDLRTLAAALDEPEVVAALRVTEREMTDIRLRAAASA